MRQSAYLQATITLLDQILSSSAPADVLITKYFHQCRYLGSRDRRVISEMVYQILRRYEELSWYLQGSSHSSHLARLLVFAYAHKIQNISVEQIEDLCQKNNAKSKFDPAPLQPFERILLTQMSSLTPEKMPLETRLNIPSWILPRLEKTFGGDIEKALQALNQAAPLDLRVNTLKTTRQAVLDQLHFEGFNPIATPWSPLGIRLADRRPLSGHPLWKQGDIEVQDEGSQLLALLVEAKPGMTVMDFCAGAGGKTLAMASTMENKGRIVATDVSLWRLNRSRERLKRAGVNNVEFRSLEDKTTTKWLKRQAARFDRVLVDAPCSGSGTWRRNPDLKRRFVENDLNELVEKQKMILDQASSLVKPQGRLVYATCSLFEEENLNQVQNFLKDHPNFRLLSIKEVWKSVFGTPCPTESDTLQLTPHSHAVDGFFVAVMERMGAP